MNRGLLFALLCVWPASAFASAYDDFNTGVNLRSREEFDIAAQYLSRALASPDLPEHLKYIAHIDLGQCYEAQNHFDQAQREYSVAIQLKPTELLGYLGRARAYEFAGRFENAIGDLTVALQNRPTMTSNYIARGADYVRLGRFDKADADFSSLLEIYPDSTAALFQLGLSQWSQGHLDQAKERFEQSLKNDETFVYAALWRELSLGPSGSSDLKPESRHFDKDKWPWPVVKFYLGDASADDVIAAAGRGEKDSLAGQKCEADFYVAERLVSQKNYVAARPLLNDAVSSCPILFPEHNAAGIALKSIAAAGTP